MTILLTYKDSDKPFVTKKGKQYFIETTKYTDDVNILLNAIKNVKPAAYDDLFKKPGKNKEEYWQKHFNYQWSGGGLILWHNPTQMWEQELARRGELNCPNCGRKMHMYYTPECPVCDFKGKAKKNLIQMIAYIEAKYNIQTRDCAAHKLGIKSSSEHNVKHQIKWEAKHYPLPPEYTENPLKGYSVNKKGIEFFDSPEGRKRSEEMREHYEKDPEGKAKEIPYQDWWHLFCECYQFSNDTSITINFQDILDNCKEDWEKEITQLFINEFGKKDIHVFISW